jgi:hypothetical protein
MRKRPAVAVNSRGESHFLFQFSTGAGMSDVFFPLAGRNAFVRAGSLRVIGRDRDGRLYGRDENGERVELYDPPSAYDARAVADALSDD